MGIKWIINYFDNGQIKVITLFAGNISIAIQEAVSTGDLKVEQILSITKL